MSIKNLLKKLLLPIFVVLFLAPNLVVNAIEFDSGDTVNVTQEATNLHVAGSNVTVNSKINKDLVAASGNLSVLGNTIGRNLNLAGGTVNVNDVSVFGTSRIAGGQVQITGTFNEDLIVFGGQINIVDATITGDLVVYGGEVTIEGATTVGGKLYGGWEDYEGLEPSSFVTGEVMINEGKGGDVNVDGEDVERAGNAFKVVSTFFREITAIVGLIIILVILGRRNRTHIPSVKFDGLAARDFLHGAVAGIVFPVAAIILVWFFWPAIIPMSFLFYGLMFVSSLFLPVYAGNLIKNTFDIDMKTRNVVIITYILLVLVNIISFIPVIGWLLKLAVFILAIMNFGFILRKLKLAISLLLSPRKVEK